MKTRKRSKSPIVHQLTDIVGHLTNMDPQQVHIINVRANYGNYQIVIGPQRTAAAPDDRPIEINGSIHHLFLSPKRISPNPSHNQVTDNLKDTVIMRDLAVHLVDEHGDGQHINASNGQQAVSARECINLAGEKGQKLINEVTGSGQLQQAAFQIIMDDILHVLRSRPEESLEDMSLTE